MSSPRKKLPQHVSKLMSHFENLFEVRQWDKGFTIATRDKSGLAATISIDEEYQRIHVTLYPCFFKASRREQRQYILHEYCHLITTPLVDLLDELKKGNNVTPHQIKAQSERATSRMANIVECFLDKRASDELRAYSIYLKKPKERKLTKVAKSKGK